eukprot:TRINITY_DN17667_c0_g1_i1.p1 TRINITY_DN17667_c0_g1~~TRINITY_DN17667_c0_g1_i1.p1  ORF type:complete len:567 (-),score=97.56 TRINITY_DN17667_c0_g1_i1:52-1551(-)
MGDAGMGSVRIADLARSVPGAWFAAEPFPGTRTNLPSALAGAGAWQKMQACRSLPAGEVSTPEADYWLSGPYLPEDRPDLVLLRSWGVRSQELAHCDLRDPEVEPSLRVFLDRAWTLGLRVVIGLPVDLYFNATDGCIFTEDFDCHNTFRIAYQRILGTELVEEGRYHPALERVLLTGALDDVAFLGRCEQARGTSCSEEELLKAVISAWDGLLKAEREMGVQGSVPISMPFSAAKGRAAVSNETHGCYGLRAPGGCAGQQMMRKLWATVQSWRLASVVVIEGDRWYTRGHGDQYGTSLESLRRLCGTEKDLVSIRDPGHVLFLLEKVLEAGVDVTREAGVPLAYDYLLQNRYWDLRNASRDVTSIFLELWARGAMNGDFHTDQTKSEYWGKDEHMAGFGWGRSRTDAGIADWGHQHAVQAVVCESINGVDYEPHMNVQASMAKRWAHSFHSVDSSADVEHALRHFYSYAPASENHAPAIIMRFGPGLPSPVGPAWAVE